MNQNDDTEKRICLGISSCLLGEPVRYNGGHKKDRYITDTLSRYFDFHPVCPEVAIGLGVPRPSIHLQGTSESPQAIIEKENNRNVTQKLASYGDQIAQSLTHISGYIFKSSSPSCGTEQVKVYDHNNIPSNTASGIYANAFIKAQSLLPVIEEVQLNDINLHDNFIERVLTYSRWQAMIKENVTFDALVEFHTQHQHLVMAYNQTTMHELEDIIASANDKLNETLDLYFQKLMRTLKTPAKRQNRENVLQHLETHPITLDS